MFRYVSFDIYRRCGVLFIGTRAYQSLDSINERLHTFFFLTSPAGVTGQLKPVIPMREDIIKIIDDYLIENRKGRLHIGNASKLLQEAGLVGSTAELKKLIETGEIPNSYQTEKTPRQWYIILSQDRRADINANPATLEIKCDKCGFAPIFPNKFSRSGQFIICPECQNKIKNPLYGRKKKPAADSSQEFWAQFIQMQQQAAMAQNDDYGYNRHDNIKSDRNGNWWSSLSSAGKIITGSIIAGILILVINLSSGNSTVFESGLTQSKAELKVKQYLRNDYLFDSGSYKPVSWTDLREKSDGTYYITHTYRAKNGFGGYIQKTNIFHLDSEGNVLDIN